MLDTRILVVGKREATVARLRSALAGTAQIDWVTTGEEALQRLRQASVDVIVCEALVNGTDVVDTFTRVRERAPQVARLVAAHPSDVDDHLRTLHVAQGVLRFHDRDEVLRDTVGRTLRLQRLIGDDAVLQIVGRLNRLPSLPRTYWDLMKAIDSTTSSSADIARIIESDPAMSVKILHAVNAAFFGLTRKATSVQQAVSLLGRDLLKGLIMSAHIFAVFDAPSANGFSLEQFQQYSTAVARLARKFAGERAFRDEAFTAGLLLDLGSMIIAARCPQQFAAIQRRAFETGLPNHDVEQEMLGTSHVEVGASLLGLWGLPTSIVEAVAFHHQPSHASDGAVGPFDLLACVHAADVLLGAAAAGIEPVELDVGFIERAGLGGCIEQWRQDAQIESERLCRARDNSR